eukprot:4419013-Alexandrium_andersonii.AAC.1
MAPWAKPWQRNQSFGIQQWERMQRSIAGGGGKGQPYAPWIRLAPPPPPAQGWRCGACNTEHWNSKCKVCRTCGAPRVAVGPKAQQQNE